MCDRASDVGAIARIVAKVVIEVNEVEAITLQRGDRFGRVGREHAVVAREALAEDHAARFHVVENQDAHRVAASMPPAAGSSVLRLPSSALVSETISLKAWPSAVKRRICGTSPTVEMVIDSWRMRPPQGCERTRAARITSS